MDYTTKAAIVIGFHTCHFFYDTIKADFKKYLQKNYKRSLFGFKRSVFILSEELFVWHCAVVDYFAAGFYLQKGMPDDARRFREIYRKVLYESRDRNNNLISVYDWWHEFIEKNAVGDVVIFDARTLHLELNETLLNGFAMKIIKHFNPEKMELGIDEFNEVCGDEIMDISSTITRYVENFITVFDVVLRGGLSDEINKVSFEINKFYERFVTNKRFKKIAESLDLR